MTKNDISTIEAARPAIIEILARTAGLPKIDMATASRQSLQEGLSSALHRVAGNRSAFDFDGLFMIQEPVGARPGRALECPGEPRSLTVSRGSSEGYYVNVRGIIVATGVECALASAKLWSPVDAFLCAAILRTCLIEPRPAGEAISPAPGGDYYSNLHDQFYLVARALRNVAHRVLEPVKAREGFALADALMAIAGPDVTVEADADARLRGAIDVDIELEGAQLHVLAVNEKPENPHGDKSHRPTRRIATVTADDEAQAVILGAHILIATEWAWDGVSSPAAAAPVQVEA